jgi:beta-glucosidase
MKDIRLQAYRLSISWPRIFPNGTGNPNEAGIAFYKNILEELKKNGIKTAVTIYHWDLPQKLQDKGGWVNRQISDDFEQYASCLFERFDGLVDWWITLNEPYCSSYLGYWRGEHAPGIYDFSSALAAAHHLLLSHGKAVRKFREMKTQGEIGIVLNMEYYYPLRDCDEDHRAAAVSHAVFNSWFTEPLYNGRYPKLALEHLSGKAILPDMPDSDFEIISSKTDFLGLNNYFSSHSTFCDNEWPLGVKNSFIGEDRTDMGWGINPEGMYDLIKWLHSEYDYMKLYITESGCATRDIVNIDGEIEDYNRIDYLRQYLAVIHTAIQDGVNLKGYF